MSAFRMTCSCGHVVNVDAADRSDAVSKIKGMIDSDFVAQHFKEKHPGQPVPPVAAVHQMVEQNVQAA